VDRSWGLILGSRIKWLGGTLSSHYSKMQHAVTHSELSSGGGFQPCLPALFIFPVLCNFVMLGPLASPISTLTSPLKL
jgi:hypothetical protein